MKSVIYKTNPIMNRYHRVFLGAVAAVAFALPAMVRAETVGVFFDQAVPQIKFAAGDVKAALEKNKVTVEMLPVASLKTSYANKKIVVALANNVAVTAVLAAQGGKKVTVSGEQAYGLRTTETPQKSYWVLGGDANGAMYGGLQFEGPPGAGRMVPGIHDGVGWIRTHQGFLQQEQRDAGDPRSSTPVVSVQAVGATRL